MIAEHMAKLFAKRYLLRANGIYSPYLEQNPCNRIVCFYLTYFHIFIPNQIIISFMIQSKSYTCKRYNLALRLLV